MADRKDVYLGLGSNIDAEKHLEAGIEALREEFGEVDCSPFYRSEAVGFSGDDFLNGVCMIATDRAPADLKEWLTELEDAHGRDRDQPKFSDRTLDIDILLHGDCAGEYGDLQLPRDEILKFAHVLKPLADLAPDLRHPVTGWTMAEHWEQFDGDRTLAVVEFSP